MLDRLGTKLCSGQGYDNAAIMVEIHGSIQSKIRDIYLKALFVPSTKSFSEPLWRALIWNHLFTYDVFGILERAHSFFSVSPHQWEILMEKIGIVVKRLFHTRWSAH